MRILREPDVIYSRAPWNEEQILVAQLVGASARPQNFHGQAVRWLGGMLLKGISLCLLGVVALHYVGGRLHTTVAALPQQNGWRSIAPATASIPALSPVSKLEESITAVADAIGGSSKKRSKAPVITHGPDSINWNIDSLFSPSQTRYRFITPSESTARTRLRND